MRPLRLDRRKRFRRTIFLTGRLDKAALDRRVMDVMAEVPRHAFVRLELQPLAYGRYTLAPACHWCHVMAHECLEDGATAALMNRHFVSIKVDREERPDIDQIYQTAHQLIAHRPGGWPLTMFLTPDAKPFFGGTYFPKLSRYNLIGFDDLLQRVAQVWQEQRDQSAVRCAAMAACWPRTKTVARVCCLPRRPRLSARGAARADAGWAVA